MMHIRNVAKAVLAIVLSGVLAGSAFAGPNCDKKPDHPSCGGGGGEDPTANPALVFLDMSHDRIEIMDADGSNRTTLLDGIYRACTYPKWSPDGTQVAFGQTTGEVYLINADGTGLVDVRAGSGVAWGGSCALDWSQGPVLGGNDLIAFVGEPEGLDEPHPDNTDYLDVYLFDPLTDEIEQLTDSFGEAEGFLTWSPSGDRLAVSRVDYRNDIYKLWVFDLAKRVDVDDPDACIYPTLNGPICVTGESEITPLPNIWSSQPISWASTHDWIMHPIDGDLFYIDLEFKNVIQITGGSGQFDVGDESFPTWSPDDSQVAFTVRGARRKGNGLYRIDLATGATEKIGNEGPRWADWKPELSASP